MILYQVKRPVAPDGGRYMQLRTYIYINETFKLKTTCVIHFRNGKEVVTDHQNTVKLCNVKQDMKVMKNKSL